MNYLIASINSEYQKVLSDNSNIVSEFQADEYQLVDYTSGYKLDDDERIKEQNERLIEVVDRQSKVIETINSGFVSYSQAKHLEF